MNANSDNELHLNAMYVGINIENILYGVGMVLYFKTIYALLHHPGERTKADVFYVLFSTVMFLLITVWISMQGISGEKMWVSNTHSSDDPHGLYMRGWYMDVATIAIVVLQLMTDGLMVYRCWVIWESPRAIIIPLILWTGTFVLGILSSWSATVSGGLYIHARASQIYLAYYTVSIILCTLLTCMICYRLLRYGKLMEEHLGREYASTYFAVVALIVESVLPYTLSGVTFLILLGIKSQIKVAFGYMYALMMCISPQMLILRVATRMSAKDSGRTQPSMVQFSPVEDTVSDVKAGDGPCGSSRENDRVV